MLYDLADGYGRERFKKRVEAMLAGQPLVELTDCTRRTGQQNKYLHVCLGIVAVETGETLDYVKQFYFKRLCNRAVFCREKRDTVTGCMVEVLRSSSELTTTEMTAAIDRFRDWSARQGWYIPSPDEEHLLRRAMAEISRAEKFL